MEIRYKNSLFFLEACSDGRRKAKCQKKKEKNKELHLFLADERFNISHQIEAYLTEISKDTGRNEM